MSQEILITSLFSSNFYLEKLGFSLDEKNLKTILFFNANLYYNKEGSEINVLKVYLFQPTDEIASFAYNKEGGRSVVKTQLLVFEQRRRAELYAKHSEAQGNLV